MSLFSPLNDFIYICRLQELNKLSLFFKKRLYVVFNLLLFQGFRVLAILFASYLFYLGSSSITIQATITIILMNPYKMRLVGRDADKSLSSKVFEYYKYV